MTYQLKHADSSVADININPLVVNNTSTDLTFVGRGIPNFGALHQTNFLLLLENFASPSAPTHPQLGQLWFDKTSNVQTLKVFLGGSHGWAPLAKGSASTSQPSETTANPGDLWYNTTTNVLYTFNGIHWVIPQSCACAVGSTPPTYLVKGQLWYDTTSRILKVQTGVDETHNKWVSVIDESLLYLSLLM